MTIFLNRLLVPAFSAADGYPYPRAAVPADGKMVLTDYGLREWGPELVSYTLDTKAFPPGRLALLGPDGKAVPFQVEDGTLSFVASLPQGQAVAYTLQKSEADRGAENTTLKVTATDKWTEIGNELIALRLPPAGRQAFDAPVAADKTTPPLLQWKAAGADWMGGTRFATKMKIVSQAFKLIRQGPACAEFESRYAFAPRGEYVLRVRLSPGMPLAVVNEEFDMGEVTDGGDFLLLELGKGWQPANIARVVYVTEQAPCKATPSPLGQIVEEKRAVKPPPAPVGGVGAEPTIPLPFPDLVKLFWVGAGAQIQGASGGVQLWDGDAAQPGAGRNFAMVSLHSGSWRRAMACPVWYRDGDGVLVGLPVSVRPIRWCFEVTDDSSPFSTHEHDDGLPRTYGRREWGLYTGTEFETAQPRFGHIGLDRCKDWIVDRPEGPAAKGAYPGSFFSNEHVARLRQALGRSPAAGDLKNRYLMSGKAGDAIGNAQSVIAKLKKQEIAYPERDFWLWGQSNYRKCQLMIFVNEAEDALACPELPADLRRELRRWLTLYAYVTSDPDWNPRGSGVHHGNNNMPINRTLALAYFAGLLPDHPCYAYWMKCVREFTEFKLATQFSPGGESIECPEYSLYAPAGALNIAQNILRHRGIADLTASGVTRRNLEYMANLTMPDARFGGARIIPGMGNSANTKEGAWGVSVATFVDHDLAFAGWCKTMFSVSKGSFGPVANAFLGHPMYYLPDVKDSPLEFKTVFMPAYGVAFRAHGGTPDETAMLLRAGCNSGHWDPDPLNVILYGKGAPLSPGTGYQYYGGVGNRNGAVNHNRVRVGKHAGGELFGRVDVTVADYGFGPSADYAMAERYLPPQYFGDDKEGSWRRHVLFLKSDRPAGPSYFVMRDTFPGAEHRNKWWTWLNLDMPDRVSVDGRPFARDQVPVEKPVEEKDMPMQHGQTIEMAAGFGASSWHWFTEPHDVRVRGIMQYPARVIGTETKTIVEALAGAGRDYFYVVFPKKDGEPTPACEKPAEGVLKIATAEAADYAFVSDAPLNFEQDGVAFSGRAGAVRVFNDRVALCMNSGNGRIGYQGMIFEGPGPFEKVVALKDLKAGVTKIEGGYEKKMVSVDIGRGITVRGEVPFEAWLDGQMIKIKTAGRARVLHVTQPPFIVRPQFWIDGHERMASWTDYPASGWGTWKNTWLMALPVPDGEHELVVEDAVFPPVWARPFTPLIALEAGR